MSHTDKVTAAQQRQIREFTELHLGNQVNGLISSLPEFSDLYQSKGYSFESDLLPILRKEFQNEDGETEIVEAHQHWIVSEWLGEKLTQKGEMVTKLFGLIIWGRAAAGQSVYMDEVIQSIVHDVSHQSPTHGGANGR